jgi:hypothetical protein
MLAALWLGGLRPFKGPEPTPVEIRTEGGNGAHTRLAARNHGPDLLPAVEIFGLGRNGSVHFQRKEQWQPGETLELGPLDQWISSEGGSIEIRANGRTLAQERF